MCDQPCSCAGCQRFGEDEHSDSQARMNPELRSSEPAAAAVEVERRKHTRHRYIERLYIGRRDGMWYTAMTYEISTGGLSAATAADLEVGEIVKLSPIVEKRVESIVRRKQGVMYGFEFLELPVGIDDQIRKLCEGLPLFQTLTNN
jgi:PilZ domain